MHPLPRSYLFVPGDRPERFAKALASGADAVVVDLEDAVAPAAKAAARDHVARLLDDSPDRARIVVRINDESADGFDADLDTLRRSGAAAVMLPKAERAATVARLLGACPGIAVLALVETARGVLAAEAVASAPGVQRLVFGTIDYALDMGLQGDFADSVGLDAAAARIALVSRACGLAPPVAGVTAAVADDERCRADLQRARAHGFAAKLCIHPRQVPVVHEVLAPSEQELAWARRVVAAADSGDATHGAVLLDGRMIDRPVIEFARRVLQRAP